MTPGGNNFNDFLEHQLTIEFAFLCKPAWGNASLLYHCSPCPDIIWGTAVPRSPPPRLHHWVQDIGKETLLTTHARAMFLVF